MMNRILPAMFVLSFISAIATGRMSELSSAVVSGGTAAVELVLSLIAAMCFWGGVMEVAEKSGVASCVSRLISPVMKLLFPRLRRDKHTLEAMSMNISANLLGLGNAATPLGLEAMRRLRDVSSGTDRASDEMVTFVVMNSAAMRIIPTTVATLRGQYGSAEPMSVLLPTLLTSACALAVGLTVAKLGCFISKARGVK